MTGIPVRPDAPKVELPRWKKRLRTLLFLGSAGLIVSSPWWGRAILRSMDFFNVRRVEVEGARYASAEEIVALMQVDTTASLWDDLDPVAARVREHPQVRDVRIGRRLPGTLVVRVTEDPPIALVNTTRGMSVTDAAGQPLPVDPTRTDVDLPVLASRDTLLLRLLAEAREELPTLYARVSEARRGARGEVILVLPEHRVIAPADVSVWRLADVLVVEEDLAKRALRVAELDLRFRDQVVARLP